MHLFDPARPDEEKIIYTRLKAGKPPSGRKRACGGYPAAESWKCSYGGYPLKDYKMKFKERE